MNTGYNLSVFTVFHFVFFIFGWNIACCLTLILMYLSIIDIVTSVDRINKPDYVEDVDTSCSSDEADITQDAPDDTDAADDTDAPDDTHNDNDTYDYSDMPPLIPMTSHDHTLLSNREDQTSNLYQPPQQVVDDTNMSVDDTTMRNTLRSNSVAEN